MMIKVFFLEPTPMSRMSLRRFASGNCPLSVGAYSYHNAKVHIGIGRAGDVCGDIHPHDDSRWPKQCGCGYTFKEEDNWQLFNDRLYKRTDTGEELVLNEAPPGAVWNAWWLAENRTAPSFYLGDDGRCLMARTPGGDWCIDSRASNCTMPDDNTHKCWVRHGKPEDATLHVDKNGHTCAAGAGSIVSGNYHGFLHGGHFTSC